MDSREVVEEAEEEDTKEVIVLEGDLEVEIEVVKEASEVVEIEEAVVVEKAPKVVHHASNVVKQVIGVKNVL